MRQVHPDVAALFRKHFTDSPRSFVELLVFTRDNQRTYADILAAADRLSSGTQTPVFRTIERRDAGQ